MQPAEQPGKRGPGCRARVDHHLDYRHQTEWDFDSESHRDLCSYSLEIPQRRYRKVAVLGGHAIPRRYNRPIKKCKGHFELIPAIIVLGVHASLLIPKRSFQDSSQQHTLSPAPIVLPHPSPKPCSRMRRKNLENVWAHTPHGHAPATFFKGNEVH